MEWVRLHSESITGRQGYAAGYKRPVELEMLDPTGVVVEKWLLDGTMLTNVGFGDLAMDDDSIAEVTTTLRFDRAILFLKFKLKKYEKNDESLNIAKANLLSEQRYLTSKGIIRESVENDGADGDETDMINYIKSLGGLKEEPLNELSPELKQSFLIQL
jgi:hypothetical protein